jgi:hypothetical protein
VHKIYALKSHALIGDQRRTLRALPPRRPMKGHVLIDTLRYSKEISMYYGGGLLGTIVIIAVIVWFVRRV